MLMRFSVSKRGKYIKYVKLKLIKTRTVTRLNTSLSSIVKFTVELVPMKMYLTERKAGV